MQRFGWRTALYGLACLCLVIVLPAHLPGLRMQVAGAVVAVVALNDRQEITARGNGFFLARDVPGEGARLLLATARHLLLGAARVEVRLPDGTAFAVEEVLAEDPGGDLVLCRTNMPAGACPPLPLAGETPQPGMALFFGDPRLRDNGARLMAVRAVDGFGALYLVTRSVAGDACGTPLLNSRRQVVGIAAFTLSDEKDGQLAVPAARLSVLQPAPGTAFPAWAAKAAPDWESSLEYLLVRGHALLALGDVKSARPCFEHVAKIDPGNAAAHTGLAVCAGGGARSLEALNGMVVPLNAPADPALATGEALNQAGKYAEALAALQQVKAESARLCLDRGIACSNLHRDGEAIAAFQRAIALDPKDPAPRLNLGLCFQRLQRFPEAEAAFQEALRLKPDSTEALARLGAFYLEGERNEEALDALTRAVAADGKNHTALINRGVALLRLKRFAEALAALEPEARRYPEDARVHYLLGVARDGAGQSDAAVREFEEAVRRDSADAAARKALGFLCARLGRSEEALAALREAVRLNPADAEAQGRYGGLCLAAGRTDAAAAALKIAAKAYPGDVSIQGNLGLAYLYLQRYGEAVAALQAAIRIDARQPLAWHSLGRAYANLRRSPEAAAALREAVRLEPDRPETLYDLGQVCLAQSHYTEAADAFRGVTRLDGQQAQAWRQLGRCQVNLKQYEEARDALKTAARLDARNAGVHYDLGIACILLKDRPGAWAEYEILRLLDKQSAADLLKRIDKFLADTSPARKPLPPLPLAPGRLR